MMRGERIPEHELVVADVDLDAVVGLVRCRGVRRRGIGRQPLRDAEGQDGGGQ